MAEIVVGTAGHIDHGKTTLVRALTGMETDTTKEEKKRGMSINLGFAYMDLPNQQRIGFVDVPGHEKFIKNMVAGLPGIHLILLVIDAAEGIMPQTKEHLDILRLLGIENFMVVLTKVDTVNDELKELVLEDIKEQLHTMRLENVAIVETDAISGTGIDKLKAKIAEYATEKEREVPTQAGRLNIDRVFTINGFGTVVTGTLLDGSFEVGDELTVLPSGIKTRIRHIQVHEQEQKKAYACQRTALNLTNISTKELQRGDVLTNKDMLIPSYMLDVKVTCLPEATSGFSLWDRVRVLVGTREVFARVVPIGVDFIGAGEEGFLQLRLEEEVVVKAGDRFILRTYSPMQTIGGGKVLEANPTKHRRFKKEVLDSLKVKEEGTLDSLVLEFMLNQKSEITSLADLQNYLNQNEVEIAGLLEELQQNKLVYLLQKNEWLHTDRLHTFCTDVQAILSEYHKKYRLRKGMPIEEIHSRLKKALTEKQTTLLLKLLVVNGLIKAEGNQLALPSFEIKMNKFQIQAKNQILKELEQAGFIPLKVDDLLELDQNSADVLELLKEEEVTFLTHEYVLLSENYQKAVDLTRHFIIKNGSMLLGDFRDMTNSSRKASMLLLEYMDKNKITKRVDNTRELV